MRFLFALKLPRDASSVPVARHIVSSTMLELGIDEDCINDVGVAVTEACTNVLKHAREDDDEYEVEVSFNRETAAIRIKDTGRGFDHESLEDAQRGVHELAPDLTRESGRGIMLMRALVDDLEFTSEPEAGTIVHLTKSITLTEGSWLSHLETARASRA
ncbi:MAG: ATP-binding protein [Actinomycetota bacterium]